jgi:hypothetical protein
MFGPEDISARRASALFGLLAAEGRSDRKRFKDSKAPKKKIKTQSID